MPRTPPHGMEEHSRRGTLRRRGGVLIVTCPLHPPQQTLIQQGSRVCQAYRRSLRMNAREVQFTQKHSLFYIQKQYTLITPTSENRGEAPQQRPLIVYSHTQGLLGAAAASECFSLPKEQREKQAYQETPHTAVTTLHRWTIFGNPAKSMKRVPGQWGELPRYQTPP